MTTLVDSESRLVDSGESKSEILNGDTSPAAFKAEAVLKQILSSGPSSSGDTPLSKEVEVLSDIESDLALGDEDQPSSNLLWDAWVGSEGGESSSMASSRNSEMILLTESRPSQSRSAPPAPPRTKLKESWSSSREGFSELRSASSTPLEASWKQFQKFAVKSGSQSIKRKKEQAVETPPNHLSFVTDKVIEHKSRILGGASVGLGVVSLGTAVGGPVGATVAAGVGLSASGVNLVASEAGRKFDQIIEDLNAQIKELDGKILRAVEDSPSSEEMKELMQRRESLGQERDQAIENRKISLRVERGSSIMGLANLGASLAALPGSLISAADAISTTGNLLTVYGGASDIADIASEKKDQVVQAATTVKNAVFGSKTEEKSPVEE